jgi:hypothetical protein
MLAAETGGFIAFYPVWQPRRMRNCLRGLGVNSGKHESWIAQIQPAQSKAHAKP